MSIYNDIFAVYERLASAKMNAFKDAINSHTHDGTNGVKITYTNLDGTIQVTQIGDNIITGDMIAHYTIEAINIANDSITVDQVNNNTAISNSFKIDDNGYALYAP